MKEVVTRRGVGDNEVGEGEVGRKLKYFQLLYKTYSLAPKLSALSANQSFSRPVVEERSCVGGDDPTSVESVKLER